MKLPGKLSPGTKFTRTQGEWKQIYTGNLTSRDNRIDLLGCLVALLRIAAGLFLVYEALRFLAMWIGG